MNVQTKGLGLSGRRTDFTLNPLTDHGYVSGGPRNWNNSCHVDRTSQRQTLTERCNYGWPLFKQANVVSLPSGL